MKTAIKSATVLAALPLVVATAHAATLIALWEFDGNYLTANQNVPYNLTPGGGVSFVPSPWGMAAEFHGGTYPIPDPVNFSHPSLDRLDTTAVPNNDSFNAGFSIMAWVKVYDKGGQPILCHDSSSFSMADMGFKLAINSSIELMVRNSSGNHISAIADGSPITSGCWYHVAATWTGPITDDFAPYGSFALYIDGQPVSYHIDKLGNFLRLNGSNPLPIRVGADLGGSSLEVHAINGAIDHLSFYSSILTAAEVQADYFATVDERPAITAPAAVAVSTDVSKCEASGVDLGMPITSDNCGVVTLANDAPAIFPEGETTVTWTVTDMSGNQSTATQTVEVHDTEAPAITCPANLSANATSLSGAKVSFPLPGASDNCSIPSVTCTPASDSTFAIGTTMVSCSATDDAGNSAVCAFSITVLGAAQQIATLGEFVQSLPIDGGLKNALLAKLQSADCGRLRAFVNQVNAQIGKKLTAAQATQLISEATRIQSVLGC